MSQKLIKNCLYYSTILVFLLFYQSAKAQYDFKKTEVWLAKNVKDLGGRALVMVLKDGKVIYEHSENDMNLKQKFFTKRAAKKTGRDEKEMMQDYDRNTKLLIASCSKWLSAALLMTFVDEKKLSLEDSVGKFLPVLSKNGKGNITIRQCLSHLTGIKPDAKAFKENKELSTDANSMDESIGYIAALSMEAKPGEAFHYSSIGLQIAAAVIEKVGGKDFETLFRERIAVPCGMTNTDFGHKKVPLAAGGAQSTANDYLKFLQMILNKGLVNGKAVLQPNSILLMQQNYISGKKIIYSPAEAGNWGYGFGEWTMGNIPANTNADAVTSPGLFGSFPWVDNKKQYAAILFCFNLKNNGRAERYMQLKQLIDESIDMR